MSPNYRNKYSLVLYTYNQQKYVAKAVQSVLLQECEQLEILLTDDCSDDRTFEIMKETADCCESKHTIKFNRNKINLGVNSHMSHSLELISGNIVIVACGDDISFLNRISKIIQYFERYNPLLVHSLVNPINLSGQTIQRLEVQGQFSKSNRVKLHRAATSFSTYVGASGAWNRVLFDKYGPINDNAIEDLILGFRAVLEGRVGFINEKLIHYRIGSGLTTRIALTDSLIEFHKERLRGHKVRQSVLEQRLLDSRTYGLREQDRIILSLKRGLRKREYFIGYYIKKVKLSHYDYPSNIWMIFQVQLREIVAKIKWRLRKLLIS